MKYWMNGFYDDRVHKNIPENAVEVPDDRYDILIQASKSGLVIAADATGFPVAVERPLAELKAEAEKKLWSNYKKYQQKYVDAEDLTLATLCASQGSAKGKSVQLWVMGLWTQYYAVKDALQVAASKAELDAVDLTPDSYGAPQYTIRQLSEEAASALATGNNT